MDDLFMLIALRDPWINCVSINFDASWRSTCLSFRPERLATPPMVSLARRAIQWAASWCVLGCVRAV